LLPSTPWLENVTVKIPKQKKRKDTGTYDYAEFKTLLAIAEQLPYSRQEGGKRQSDHAWERGELVDRLINLMTEQKGNVLLVGKSGVGKSTIIYEAIRNTHTREKAKKPMNATASGEPPPPVSPPRPNTSESGN
ncbi:MAG: ATP-binding protein, partial [Bacteroidia bacterium]|nr:ATP-binding protein [Bacteroidia bacterium]